LLGEQPADPRNAMYLLLRNFDNIYRMDEVPDYEPDDTKSIAAMARARGISAIEMAYDLLLEDDGHALLFVPFADYVDRNLDATPGMGRDPNRVVGRGDGGAHYGMVADSRYPTTLVAHGSRDRPGERIGIFEAVKILAADTADLMGFRDRGRIAVGKKA